MCHIAKVNFVFPSCSQGRVFEHRLKRNGYFAMHLLEYLGDHEKNVEQVLLEVAKGLNMSFIYIIQQSMQTLLPRTTWNLLC